MRYAAVVTGLAILAALGVGHAAEAPKCGAVSFHGLPSGMRDGESDAGLYNAKFGRITIAGIVKGGEAVDYTIAVNGAKLAPLTELPAASAACLTEKGVKPPASAAPQPCNGERLKLVIVPSGAGRLLVLFAGRAKDWHYCRAVTVG